MIQHPNPPGDKPFIFAVLGSFSCSICAPLTMSQAGVEAFAAAKIRLSSDARWRAVDKALPPLSLGDHTPNPCNHAPATRQHWFLLCERDA